MLGVACCLWLHESQQGCVCNQHEEQGGLFIRRLAGVRKRGRRGENEETSRETRVLRQSGNQCNPFQVGTGHVGCDESRRRSHETTSWGKTHGSRLSIIARQFLSRHEILNFFTGFRTHRAADTQCLAIKSNSSFVRACVVVRGEIVEVAVAERGR